MRKFFLFIFIASCLAAGAVYLQSVQTPCNQTLKYSIGEFDSRFGITKDQFIKAISDEEKVWETPLNKDLFAYDPNATFKFNLIFDERQQRTIDERNLKTKIDLSSESYDSLIAQYNNLNFQHTHDVARFEENKAAYEQRLQDYNNEVAYWNKQGGAPSEDYKRLSQDKQALNSEGASIDKQRLAVNAQVSDLNALASRVNSVAQKLNVDVKDYNGKFGTPRQFDEGTYTGSAINIFQFNEESDLRLVLAHEMGHALGLEHVSDPKAIMYYLMDKQDLDNISLVPADAEAIKKVCNLQ